MAPRHTRILLITIGVAVALTRLLALSHSLWEWDEALFCLGVRDFNVAAHHPHPPGFPLYILLGKLFRFFTSDEFHALRAINVLSAMLVFPATYMLARELKLEVMPSISAALLTSFAPNVWFYGGTAFSDVPTLTMLLFGAALLLRGRPLTRNKPDSREARALVALLPAVSGEKVPQADEGRVAYYAGCIVMAAACVMRPQNVLLGAYPFLAASWPRWRERKRDPILGALLVIVIVGAFFGGAAYVTGFHAYRDVLTEHSRYVLAVDSFHNPGRTAWYRTWRDFLLDPYNAGRVSIAIATFAAIGLLRFRRPALESLAIFGPFVVFSLFMLNPESGGRYAVTSMPMLMICCAEGMRVVADAIRPWLQTLFVLIIVGYLIQWTMPALAEVRNHDAPTYAGMQWIRQHVDPRTSTIFVNEMKPLADYLLSDYRRVPVNRELSGVLLPQANGWLISEARPADPGAMKFSRPRGHLFRISRKRYFDVTVQPVVSDLAFVNGWYGEEGTSGELWRWMGRESITRLVPFPSRGELALTFDVPLDAEPRKPVATISFNRQVIDRIVCDARVEKRWVLPSNAATPNVLTIELDEVANPGADPRVLGLRLRAASWRAVGAK